MQRIVRRIEVALFYVLIASALIGNGLTTIKAIQPLF
jgi:Flp pilus assembly pilin Flp